MSRINIVLYIALVIIGFLIFFFSLYTASLSGLRSQLGFVGGDLSQSVDINRLYRGVVETESTPICNYWESVAPVPRYIFASGDTRLVIARELSIARVECAIVYTLAGNVERGVYTLLKALRYEIAGLLYIEQQINNEMGDCSLYQPEYPLGLVESYLESVDGAARSIIEREYRETQRLRGKISEMCGV